MAGRSHLSIGEVLSLLQDEFPDVTISKIRFLESQGLVDPERTPSGYRKFYEEDIERLRWVLRQQRDAFLPLKVIKGRLEGQGSFPLDEAEPGEPSSATGELQGNGGAVAGEARAEKARAGEARAGEARAEKARAGGARAGGAGRSLGSLVGTAAAGAPPPSGPADASPSPTAPDLAVTSGPSTPEPGASRETPPPEGEGGDGVGDPEPAQRAMSTSEAVAAPRAQGAGRRRRGERGSGGPPVSAAGPAALGRSVGAGDGEEQLSLDELLRTAGVVVETVQDLERYGLIAPKLMAGVPYYSREAAVVAGLAAAFARHGVEARHLRAYKGAAEREAGVVQQVVMPLIRQRNPEARRAASRAVEELSSLGAELRAVLLREALSELR